MALINLDFTKKGSSYEASYLSQGETVIQLQRNTRGIVSVSGALDGMRDVVLGTYDNPYSTDALFSVDAPVGVKVTIRTSQEVTKGSILSV